MATGRQAFGGGTGGAIIEAVLTRPPVSVRSINPDIPPRLEAIIDKALHKDRGQRYQRAADMLADLQRLKRETDSGRRVGEEGSESVHAIDRSPVASTRSGTSTAQTGSIRAPRVSKIIGSLAVLPFENVSRDPENEYLSDGITGSLINILATVPKLRVMAQSTVFRYKGREIDPQAVGRELNVRAVLTGRMMQSGGSLRIGTELVDVATGSQLWGAQFDRKPGDIFVIQDEISNEISGKLRLQLTRAEKKRLIRRHTEDAEAYRLYLQGASSLEPMDGRRILQGDRVLSASSREGPQLCSRLHWFGRIVRAPGMEQLSAAEGRIPERQSGRDDRPGARPGSRRSPHASGSRVVASRLAVARGSDRIQTQPRTKSQPIQLPIIVTPSI